MPQLLSLNRLNLDVWLEIIAFLFDPRDILSLRMTSSSLCQITLHRSVWIRALKSLCLLEGAPLCSFSFETITTTQAEQYTLRPYRFLANIVSPAPTLLRNVGLVDRTRKDESGAWEDELSVGLDAFWTIPGGRYAITINDARWMSVWDMGDATNEDAQPIMTTSIYIGGYPLYDDELQILLLDPQSKIRIVFKFRTSPDDHLGGRWLNEHRFLDIDLKIRGGRRPEQPLLERVFPLPPQSDLLIRVDLDFVSHLQRLSLAPQAPYAFDIDFGGRQIRVRDLVRELNGIIEIDRSLDQTSETPLLPPFGHADQVEFVVGTDACSNRVLVHMLFKRRDKTLVISHDVNLFVSWENAQMFRTREAYNVARLDPSLADPDDRHPWTSIRYATNDIMMGLSGQGRGCVMHFPPPSASTPIASTSAERATPPPNPPFVVHDFPSVYRPAMVAGHLVGTHFIDGTQSLCVETPRLGERSQDMSNICLIDAPIDNWDVGSYSVPAALDVWRGAMYLLNVTPARSPAMQVFEFTEPV